MFNYLLKFKFSTFLPFYDSSRVQYHTKLMFGIFPNVLPEILLQNMLAHVYAQLLFSTIMRFNSLNNIWKFQVCICMR